MDVIINLIIDKSEPIDKIYFSIINKHIYYTCTRTVNRKSFSIDLGNRLRNSDKLLHLLNLANHHLWRTIPFEYSHMIPLPLNKIKYLYHNPDAYRIFDVLLYRDEYIGYIKMKEIINPDLFEGKTHFEKFIEILRNYSFTKVSKIGNIRLLEWLHKNNLLWVNHLIYNAASSGDLQILKDVFEFVKEKFNNIRIFNFGNILNDSTEEIVDFIYDNCVIEDSNLLTRNLTWQINWLLEKGIDVRNVASNVRLILQL